MSYINARINSGEYTEKIYSWIRDGECDMILKIKLNLNYF